MKILKLISAILAMVMLFAFASCAKPEGGENATEKPTEKAVATDAPTSAPTQAPTQAPTEAPTEAPTQAPTEVPTEVPNTKLLIPYVTKGLVALYEGNYNTEEGQNKESTTWQDLSGNGNDIVDIKLGDKTYWTDEGLYVDNVKIVLPASIPELINSDEYTVEFCISGLVVDGSNFATFLNSDTNDNFALFIRQADNSLEFKSNTAIGARPKMIGEARELCETSTIAVTFSSLDTVELFFNGEFQDSVDAPENTAMQGNFFIGHPASDKAYHGVITGIRFYNRVLSEKELAANYKALGTVQANPNYTEEG